MSDLTETSVVELARLVASGTVSAREVVEAHLRRIDETNGRVNAIVTLTDESALAAAAAADEKLQAGEPVGPLHGIPVAHKDTLPTKGVRTTSGSPLFANNVPDQDHLIVSRARASGAISVGKTNVPELGLGSHTYNSLFGPTRNPYDLRMSAGGSSGGSAAAVAAGMVPFADGSDTGGSLRNPASFCNVAALRPTAGLVPSWPDAFAWSPLSVKGPLARTTQDLAYILAAISGPDRRSPLVHDMPPSEFLQDLTGDLRGRTIAWSPDLGGQVPLDPAVRSSLAPVRDVLVSLGATVIDEAPDLSEADEVFRVVRAVQMEAAYGQLLDEDRDMLGADAAWNIEEGRHLTGPEVGRVERMRTTLWHRMRTFFERFDVVVAAAGQVPPFAVEMSYPRQVDDVPMTNYLEWMRVCTLVSATGCPAMSVPAAFTQEGLPIGLQIIGPARSDLAILKVGHRIEEALGATRIRPIVGREALAGGQTIALQ